MVLFNSTQQFEHLARQILTRFANRVATVGEIEAFVLAGTAFCHTHYKKQVLRPLERADPPRNSVLDAPPARRSGTFASPDLRIQFL